METIKSNSVFNVLNEAVVPRRELPLDTTTDIEGAGRGFRLVHQGLRRSWQDRPVPRGQASDKKGFGSRDGDTIGLEVTRHRVQVRRFSIFRAAPRSIRLWPTLSAAPRLSSLTEHCSRDDEMIAQGLLNKTGQRMGHISMSGRRARSRPSSRLAVKRKVYVHINNSNPVLDENSAERKEAEAAGWEIGYDGMELHL